MANDLNSSLQIGTLTRDAELKYTNSGQAVTKMSIANNYSRKQGDQWVDEVNYFDITLWGRQGEALNQYLTKGAKIGVDGVLRQDRWEQDGQQRSKVYILANNIQLLGSKQQGQQSNQGGYGSHQQQSNNSYNNQGGSGNFSGPNNGPNNEDLDIPF